MNNDRAMKVNRHTKSDIPQTVIYFLLIFVTTTCLSDAAYSEVKEFVKDYTYQAGDFDSKISSRTIALEQVKRLLLEELGTYLTSETETSDFRLTKDQIATYSAGIISASIVEEEWNGTTYYLKARLAVNPEEHIGALRKFINSKRETKNIQAVRDKAAELTKDIELLRRELKQTQLDVDKMKQYSSAVKELNATDWYEKGLVLGRSGDLHGALEAHTRAIEMNPECMEAYSMRALLYVRLGNNKSATENFIGAARLGDKRARKLLKMKGISWQE